MKVEKIKVIEEFREIFRNESQLFLCFQRIGVLIAAIEPILPRVEADFPAFSFYYVDRDQFIELCGVHDIFGILASSRIRMEKKSIVL